MFRELCSGNYVPGDYVQGMMFHDYSLMLMKAGIDTYDET